MTRTPYRASAPSQDFSEEEKTTKRNLVGNIMEPDNLVIISVQALCMFVSLCLYVHECLTFWIFSQEIRSPST